MSSASPKWKNPADVMKLRTVKRRTLTRRKTIHDPTDLSSVLNPSTDRPVINKRKNPFGFSAENKRPNHGADNLGADNLTSEQKDKSRQLFKSLDVSNERVANESRSDSPFCPNTDGGRHLTNHHDKENCHHAQSQWSELKANTQETKHLDNIIRHVEKPPVLDSDVASKPPVAMVAVVYHQHLPVDWSVKVKMRIVSEASLAWCTQLKMVDEAKAITQHVQRGQPWYGEDKRSAFHSCCLHWVHPNIPWQKPFPRILPEQKISNVSIVGANEEATKALHRDWMESFTSAFHLLRTGKCPYFYLCTHQFTVVFHSSGVNKRTTVNASLTPTTRGLREALKTEGISFRMPNLAERKLEISPDKGGSSSQTAYQDTELGQGEEIVDTAAGDGSAQTDGTPPCNIYEDDEDADLIDNDEGASVWLESMGLDKKNFPSLDPNKVKIQREGFRRVDNRPESLVYVEGADVQALFNFLLNCRSCTASSGPQAGIPPTILSPVAFKGATLKPNKLKHSVAKKTDSTGIFKKSHVIEISGPILPHHVLNIAHLLREIQEEDFTLTFNTHGPTSPLNLREPVTISGSCKELETSGLHPLAHMTLCGSDCLADNRVYKEVHSTQNGFQYDL